MVKKLVVDVAFTFYRLRQSPWGRSSTVNSILNSINLQDDFLMSIESATLHFLSTIIEEIGIVDHKKFPENNDSSNETADNEEVNENFIGLFQQHSSRQKLKTFLKSFRIQKLTTRIGAKPRMFAKGDLNLNRTHLEQPDKLDANFNQKFVTVGPAKDSISNVK